MKKEKLKAVLPIAVIALIFAVSTLAVAQNGDNEPATYALRSPLEASEVLSQLEASEVELKTSDGSALPMALSTIISDPNEGKTVDVKQLDADCVCSGSTLTGVTISVVYYTSINTSNQLTYIWLDTDQNPSTGIKESDAPGLGLNDIGADRVILVYQGLAAIGDENFDLISMLPVSFTSNSHTLTIPIGDLADDGCMDVSLISGIDVDPVTATDVAPNTGHGTIDCDGNGGNCLLTISQLDSTTFPTIKAITMITDQQGNPISGLTESDFTVTENGQNANIISVNCGGAAGAIDVALALDASGSMDSTDKANVKTAANMFVDYMGTSDKGAVVSFASDVAVKQSLTSDKTALHNAINNYDLGVGSMTSLYDAIIVSVDQVKYSPDIKVTIVLTDGADTASSHTLQEAIDHAVANGVPVFTIGIGSVDSATLQQIATQTGGRYYYAPTSSELQQIYTLISQQISSQCKISWTTPFPCPTTVIDRNVEISVSHGGMTCSGTGLYSYDCGVSGNCTLIHLDGKNCVNQPFVARLTEEDETPIQGTITFSIGGSQYSKATDAQGYTTFKPETTGTLTATYFDSSMKRWEVTCEIIDDPTLCDGGGTCNFCPDPTQGTVSITSFTTDKFSYTRGQTIKVTMVANNAETCIYKKLLTDVSATESSTGKPLGFSGSWSMFDTGTNTYEMRMYIPTAIAPGKYDVAGGIYTDYIAQGGMPKAIASPVTVTIS